jgi:superfamily II DNA/RNA helicase
VQVAFLVIDDIGAMIEIGFESNVKWLVEECGMPSPQSGRRTVVVTVGREAATLRLARELLGSPYFEFNMKETRPRVVTHQVLVMARRERRTKLLNILGCEKCNFAFFFVC